MQIYNIGVDFEMSNLELTRRIHDLVNVLISRSGCNSFEEKDFVNGAP